MNYMKYATKHLLILFFEFFLIIIFFFLCNICINKIIVNGLLCNESLILGFWIGLQIYFPPTAYRRYTVFLLVFIWFLLYNFYTYIRITVFADKDFSLLYFLPEISLSLFVVFFFSVIIMTVHTWNRIIFVYNPAVLCVNVLLIGVILTGVYQSFLLVYITAFQESVIVLWGSNILLVSPINSLLRVFFTFCVSFILWQLEIYIQNYKLLNFEYAFFILFLLFSLWFSISTNSLILIYLLLELQALCLLLLIVTDRLLLRSTQTALRYGVVNFIASLFLLYGIIRYVLDNYGYEQLDISLNSLMDIEILKIYPIVEVILQPDADVFIGKYNITFIKYASIRYNVVMEYNFYIPTGFDAIVTPIIFIRYLNVLSNFDAFWLMLILLGLVIKLGIGPFSFWIPGIYGGITLPAFILFSTLPKLVYCWLWLLIVQYNCLMLWIYNIKFWCWLISIWSGVVGVLGIFTEKYNIFRFIGWSSIVNFGLVFLGISFVIEDVFFYTLKYKISLLNRYIFLFIIYYCIGILLLVGLFSFIYFFQVKRSLKWFSDFQVFNRHYLLVTIYIVGICCLLNFFGLPPFIGFWVKFLMFKFFFKVVIYWYDFFSSIFIFVLLIIGGFTYIRIFNIISVERFDNSQILSIIWFSVWKLKNYGIFFFQCQLVLIASINIFLNFLQCQKFL